VFGTDALWYQRPMTERQICFSNKPVGYITPEYARASKNLRTATIITRKGNQ